MLLRLNAGIACCRLAEIEKPTNLKPEFLEFFVLSAIQNCDVRRLQNTIVSRYILPIRKKDTGKACPGALI